MKLKIIKKYNCSCGKDRYPHSNIRKQKLHQQGKLTGYNIMKIETMCCEQMKLRISEADIIMFGNPNFGEINNTVNIINYDNCCDRYNVIPIHFCPFCAEKIIITEDD